MKVEQGLNVSQVERAQRIVIIGAGPAGLTAAYRLCQQGNKPVVLESDPDRVGGLSRSVTPKGYHFDFGGLRFFSI